MVPLFAFALLGGLVIWAANRYKFQPATAGGNGSLTTRTDAHVAFQQIQREQPELIAASTAEMQRLGGIAGDPTAARVLLYMGDGEGPQYGTAQRIAQAVESLRARGYLMTAGLMQRVLERMVGRA